LLALFEPVAVAVHFQDVDVVGSAGRAARRSASRIRTRRSTRRTAVLGTTITPYCFFWQASQEAEDERVDPAAHTLLAAPEEAPVVRALFWSAVINGVVAVPLMVIIMLMAMRRDVMGRFVLPRALWATGCQKLVLGTEQDEAAVKSAKSCAPKSAVWRSP
jgi:hypothetical protein